MATMQEQMAGLEKRCVELDQKNRELSAKFYALEQKFLELVERVDSPPKKEQEEFDGEPHPQLQPEPERALPVTLVIPPGSELHMEAVGPVMSLNLKQST